MQCKTLPCAVIGMFSVALMFLISCCNTSSAYYVRRDDTDIAHRFLKSSNVKRSFNYSVADWHDDSKGKAGDEFGNAVAVQNQVALVASPLQSDYPLYEVSDGKVFVYIDSAGTNEWSKIREITGEDASEFFGSCVALHHSSSGNYFAVVGAPRGNRYGQFSGGVYYFDVQIDPAKSQDYPVHLVQKERHGDAHFGSSVAISEMNGQVRVAVGATGHRANGAVFVYTRAKDGSLTNEIILYGSVAKSGGQFGYSVAFNENLVIVGAPMLQHGMVFVFGPTDGQGSSFSQLVKLSPPATASSDTTNDDTNSNGVYYYFGGAVAVGNNYLFVGCPLNNLRGMNSGSVYVYDLADKANPNFVQTLFPPVDNAADLDYGWALSFDPVYKRLIVGSCNRQAEEATSGRVFVYSQKGIGYFIEASLHADMYLSGRVKTEASSSLFGKSVSIHGDYAVVGAPFGNGEQYASGDVYFYKALSKEESETSGDSSGEGLTSFLDLGSVNAQIAIVAAVFLIVLIALYRRYSTHGDDEGFGNFLVTECVTEAEDVSYDEDSAHSQHPMLVKSSKEGGKKKGKKGAGKTSAGKKGTGSGAKLGKAGARAAYSSVRNDDL